MSLREEQCNKVCRILDNVLANRPTERDSLIVAVRKAFKALAEPSQVAKDMARIVENGQDMRVIAQPEIIRCKDCKHWIPYDWMFSEVWESKNIADYPEDEIGCNYCDMSMKANDFCGRGERREVTE